jgi:putative nucleotidyltransferase with HDIG domain
MINRTEALKILEEEGIKGRVLKHSLKVNEVAMFLGKKLVKKGKKINLNLLDVASLLHDIGKKLSDETDLNHVDAGAKILQKGNLEKIAEIIKKHSINSIIEKEKIPQTWEEKLIYYTDRRVKEDNLVSIDERLKDMKKRYPKIKSMIEKVKPKIKELEDEIFGIIRIDPDFWDFKK